MQSQHYRLLFETADMIYFSAPIFLMSLLFKRPGHIANIDFWFLHLHFSLETLETLKEVCYLHTHTHSTGPPPQLHWLIFPTYELNYFYNNFIGAPGPALKKLQFAKYHDKVYS